MQKKKKKCQMYLLRFNEDFSQIFSNVNFLLLKKMTDTSQPDNFLLILCPPIELCQRACKSESKTQINFYFH